MKISKYKYLIILLMATTFSVLAFDYELNFRGFDAPLLKRIGCGCDDQTSFDLFLSTYNKDVARRLHMDKGIHSGVLKKNTHAAKGFMNTYTNLPLTDFIGGETTKPYDGIVVYVGWTEFGGD